MYRLVLFAEAREKYIKKGLNLKKKILVSKESGGKSNLMNL